jgi:hypothetical protein
MFFTPWQTMLVVCGILLYVKSKGNQKGLIWVNLLPLSKMSYQE